MSLPVPEPHALTRFLIPGPGPRADALVRAALRRAGSAPALTVHWVRLVEDLPPGPHGLLDDGVLVADASWSGAGNAVPDREMTAALSALTGGFVVSQPLQPLGEHAGCLVAYAGHRLATEPPGGRGVDPLQQSSDLLYAIAGRSLGMLYAHRASEQGETAAEASGSSNHDTDDPTRLLVAMVTAAADEVRPVLSSRRTDLLTGWRILGGLTPDLGSPFAILRAKDPDAVVPEGVLRELSEHHGWYAAALDLPATDAGSARWVRTGPDGRFDTGVAHSVAAVVTALSGVAAVLGTYPSTLAWPWDQAGDDLVDAG